MQSRVPIMSAVGGLVVVLLGILIFSSTGGRDVGMSDGSRAAMAAIPPASLSLPQSKGAPGVTSARAGTDQLCGIWTDVGNYPSNIVGNAAVTLGSFLYSFGGYNGAYTNYAARYNGTSWAAIAPLPAERFQPFVATDGTSIYIAGGLDGLGNSLPTLWRYNPGTNNYTTLAPMPSGQQFGAGAILGAKFSL